MRSGLHDWRRFPDTTGLGTRTLHQPINHARPRLRCAPSTHGLLLQGTTLCSCSSVLVHLLDHVVGMTCVEGRPRRPDGWTCTSNYRPACNPTSHMCIPDCPRGQNCTLGGLDVRPSHLTPCHPDSDLMRARRMIPGSVTPGCGACDGILPLIRQGYRRCE